MKLFFLSTFSWSSYVIRKGYAFTEKWKSERSFKSRRKLKSMHLRELDDRKKSAEY